MNDTTKMKLFEAWCPYYGQGPEDKKSLLALDHKQAAIEWAKWFDGCSVVVGDIVSGDKVVVLVRDPEDRSLFAFEVTGKYVPNYFAQDIDYFE